jgi:hypothetical protein
MLAHWARSLPSVLLMGVTVACGSTTFENRNGEGGGAGKESGGSGGTVGGSGGDGAIGGKGGTAGSGTGGRGGTSGRGGTGTGGTGTGGTGTGGGITGGTGGDLAGMGAGGSNVGGTGGDLAGGGAGGSHAGMGGSAGVGGSMAGTGGSTAGTGGCGVCVLAACAAPFMVTVTATGSAAIADLTAEANFGVTCYAGGGTPCQWQCQSTQYQLPAGDYSVTLSAPGFDPKTIDFTINAQTGCGCCGCPCTQGYFGSVMLDGDGEADSCCADRSKDVNHCGTCGNFCETSEVCNAGMCEAACLSTGASCGAGIGTCCSGLTCCSGAADAPTNCYVNCPP